MLKLITAWKATANIEHISEKPQRNILQPFYENRFSICNQNLPLPLNLAPFCQEGLLLHISSCSQSASEVWPTEMFHCQLPQRYPDLRIQTKHLKACRFWMVLNHFEPFSDQNIPPFWRARSKGSSPSQSGRYNCASTPSKLNIHDTSLAPWPHLNQISRVSAISQPKKPEKTNWVHVFSLQSHKDLRCENLVAPRHAALFRTPWPFLTISPSLFSSKSFSSGRFLHMFLMK